jgi:selenocysteine-specific elongation factor
VLSAPGHFVATKHMDAKITLLDSAPLLKNRARVHFHQGTASTVAQVVLMEGSELAPGDSALAHFVFRNEIFLLPGDRFILRRFSPVETIGGGVVLQTGRRKKIRDPQIERLSKTIASGDRQEIFLAILESTPKGLSLDEVISRTAWPEDEALAIAEMLDGKRLVRILSQSPKFMVAGSVVDTYAARLLKLLAELHDEKPLQGGISWSELRARMGGDGGTEIFPAALAQLTLAGSVVIWQNFAKLPGHGVQLNAEETRIRQAIEVAYAQSGLVSPAPEDVFAKLGFDKSRAQSFLQLLLRESILIKVADGIIFHASALADLREKLAKRRRENNSRLSVPAFKELAGVSRKYAIPLLEYLDRTGVTRRDGDERIVI